MKIIIALISFSIFSVAKASTGSAILYSKSWDCNPNEQGVEVGESTNCRSESLEIVRSLRVDGICMNRYLPGPNVNYSFRVACEYVQRFFERAATPRPKEGRIYAGGDSQCEYESWKVTQNTDCLKFSDNHASIFLEQCLGGFSIGRTAKDACFYIKSRFKGNAQIMTDNSERCHYMNENVVAIDATTDCNQLENKDSNATKILVNGFCINVGTFRHTVGDLCRLIKQNDL